MASSIVQHVSSMMSWILPPTTSASSSSMPSSMNRSLAMLSTVWVKSLMPRSDQSFEGMSGKRVLAMLFSVSLPAPICRSISCRLRRMRPMTRFGPVTSLLEWSLP